jgi:tRNA pseudouridine65 synthase
VDEPCAIELSILYRDDALLIVNKPAGLVVHRGWANDRITLLELARDAVGSWVYPAHRLDRQTSGALIFGLNPEIARRLERELAQARVDKRYVALVRGMAPDAAFIDHPLAKEKGKEKLSSQTEMRRLAHFEVESDETGISRRYSWVEARPLTGRPHQIRRHLKHISHPIVGDVRYGKAEHNRLFRRRFGLERMVLHAARVALSHPIDGRRLVVDAPLPSELSRLLEALGAAPSLAAAGRDPELAEAQPTGADAWQHGRPEASAPDGPE